MAAFQLAYIPVVVRTFHLESAWELIDDAKGCSGKECAAFLEKTARATHGLDQTPEKNRLDHAMKGRQTSALAALAKMLDIEVW